MNNTIKIIVSLFIIITLTACCGGDASINKMDRFISKQAIDKTDPAWKTKLSQPPLLGFTPGKDYFWELQTNQGNLTIKLLTESAPMHVSSTIYLTNLGFYDDLTFHRVIPGFMAQGGDPTGTGAGNPGYRYDGEFTDNFDDDLGHNSAGTLSMANAGPGTDGSQFFLTFAPTPFLNGKHTVFGKVVTGVDVDVDVDVEDSLTKIEALGSRSGRTKEVVKIIKATIRIADSK